MFFISIILQQQQEKKTIKKGIGGKEGRQGREGREGKERNEVPLFLLFFSQVVPGVQKDQLAGGTTMRYIIKKKIIYTYKLWCDVNW